MSVFKRLGGIIQGKTNKALDKMEDPRDTLDLSYQQQLEQLQQVRKGLAEITTARKRIELQATKLQQNASKLQDQARQALAANREDLAREALSRRAGIATQLEGLKTQHDQISGQEDKLIQTSKLLEARVEAFRTQKETLKATYTAAQAQTKINEAVAGISESMTDTGMAMQRAQDKIEQMQARASAVDELLASGALTDLSGSGVDPFQSELDKTSQSGQVELEMARMKSQLGTGSSAGELAAAGSPASKQADEADAVTVPDSSDSEVAEGELTSGPAPAPPPAAPPPVPQAVPAKTGGSGGDLFSLDGGS
jgi:phage shock protein A